MTHLIASLSEHSFHGLLAGAKSALQDGADLVELRLDELTQGWDEIPNLVKQLPPYRWVATCRPTSEGGHYDGPLVDRVSLLLAVGSAAPGFIDFEFQDWQRSANIRQKLELATAIRPGDPHHPHQQRAGGRLILSRHFDHRPEDPIAAARDIANADFRGPMKIVWPASDPRDNFAAFEILRQAGRPTVALCTGEAGLLSRVLAPKFGAFASYAAADVTRPTAAGQAGVADMIETFRWKSISASTRWFGVIGYPVAQSLGKHVHNALFARHGLDAVYVPLPVVPAQGVLELVLDDLERLDWLDFGGGSVTIPHKEHVRRWLGSRVDTLSARIGAVNTLYKQNNRLLGTNTDYSGFVESLSNHAKLRQEDGAIGNPKSEFRNPKSVDVLGAGGAARAVVCALRDLGAEVCIFNRTESKAQSLADEFGCRHAAWESRNDSTAPILINTTSMGMGDLSAPCPVTWTRLARKPLVMDLVFKPLETRLLTNAHFAGCPTVDGLAMYAHQAAAQFMLWTGDPASADEIRSIAARRNS